VFDLGMMSNIKALGQKDHVLGNVRGVIRDSLQPANDSPYVESLPDAGGVLLHEFDEPIIYR
jgi:hypothetical protein